MDILNDILACVSVGLDAVFPDYPIFVELIPDELPERCFILDYAGEAIIRHELGIRYRVSGSVDIKYLAPKRGQVSKRENNSVFLELSLKLHHLAYKKIQLNLEKHTRRDVDDVLHDICEFTTFLYELNPTPVMESLEQHPTITT